KDDEAWRSFLSSLTDKGPKINFEIVHIWSYGYLLRRLREVAEEYGIEVEFVDEESASKTCPIFTK
ncbi:MAG: zinc ribbon domain-containing protein, partial [Sulfolobales archaeon]